MAASPKIKVFDETGFYRASFKLFEDAALFLGGMGGKGQIRIGHSKSDILYTNEVDGDASESYDEVAAICEIRLRDRREKREKLDAEKREKWESNP